MVRSSSSLYATPPPAPPSVNAGRMMTGHRDALFHRIGDVGRHDGLADLLHGLFEQLPVLRPVDRVDVRADQFYPPLIEKSFLRELASDREARLSAEGGEQAVRPLLFDDALYGFERERFEIDLVRERFIRHDGRGVGVAKDDVHARVFEHAARLRARIVEFRRLSDDDRPRTDDEYFFDIASLRHSSFLRPSSS